jgi:hypothetical protein
MEDGQFRKSTSSGMDCLEARPLADGSVECRHSGDPGGPLLRFSRSEWRAFVDGAKRGEFDFDD